MILHAIVRAELKMADACVQTHSSQAGDNLDMDELEVQTASATLNLTQGFRLRLNSGRNIQLFDM